MSLKKKDPKVAVKATAAAAQEKANDELAEAATDQAEASEAQAAANEKLAEASEAQAAADAAKADAVKADAVKADAKKQGIPDGTVIKVMNNGAHNLHDGVSKITYRAKTVNHEGKMTSWLRAQVRAGNFSILPKVAE